MRERHARFLVEQDHREHEAIRTLLAYVLRPDDNCVDLGANSGDILRELVRLAPRGRHVACEPVPALAAELTRDFPGVQVHPCAVSDNEGRRTFYHVADEAPLSSLRVLPYFAGHPVEKLEVEVTTLDALLPGSYVPAVVKADVEGAEIEVLRGGLKVLRRHKPLLILEFTRDGAGAFEVGADDLHGMVCGALGMRLFDIFGHGPYDVAELRKVFRARRINNYVAHR
jgi:FkbM family methyltransferase